MVCEQTGCTLKVAPINRRGELRVRGVPEAARRRARAWWRVAHVSNALGTVLPVKRIVEAAHAHGAVVLVDGAQAVPHSAVDVRALGADFYAFSAHKLYGPTGIGVLYGREALLAGDAAVAGRRRHDPDRVLREDAPTTSCRTSSRPARPNISGAVGLAAAMDYVEGLGIEAIAAHEQRLLQLATAELQRLPDIEIIGTAAHKASVLSFTMEGVHPHDLGTILDAEGVAVRTGHHCAMPVMTFFGLPATARASFGCYNTEEDVAALVAALQARARGVRLMDLKDLYRDVILDHNRQPRNFGRLEPAGRAGGRPQPAVRRPPHRVRAPERRARRGHPLRGQGLRHLHRLRLAHDRSGQGQGSRRHPAACSTRCTRCSRSRMRRPMPSLGKLAALSGVREFPARVKCASLCWHTLNAALDARRGHRFHRMTGATAMRRHENEPFVVNREVRAVIVPAGAEVKLKPGQAGYITQALGGSFTVYSTATCSASPARMPTPSARKPVKPPRAAAQCRRRGREASSPGSRCAPATIRRSRSTSWTWGSSTSARCTPNEDGTRTVEVKITLTAPGCGMGDVLVDDVRDKIERIPTVRDVQASS